MLKFSKKNIYLKRNSITYNNKTINLNDVDKKIMNIIKNDPNVTIEECSMKVNKSIRTINNIFKKLKELNLLERIGSKKTGYWIIK